MLLRKKTYQICLMAIVFFVGSFFATSAILANDPVDPNVNDLVVDFNPNPLFSEDNFLPGDSTFSYAIVSNNSDEPKPIAIETINIINDDLETSGKFGDGLTLIIKKAGEAADCFNGTLTAFFNKGEFLLSEPDLLDSGESITYNFFVSFDESSGDSYQGKSLGFDVLIGFQGGESVSDGEGGSSESLQGLIIKREKVVAVTGTTATIEWWTSYNATSQIIYCKASENCSLDLSDNANVPPLYGYNYTTDEENAPANQNGVTYREITIMELQENTIYDFRCISHASPPTVSRDHSFTTLAIDNDKNDSIQENETNDIENNTTDSTQKYGDNNKEYETNGNSNSKKTEIISNINKIFNSANNFISSVLGSESTNEIDKSAINLNNKQEDNIKDIFKESHSQISLSMILLLLMIVILLYLIYRFSKKNKV